MASTFITANNTPRKLNVNLPRYPYRLLDEATRREKEALAQKHEDEEARNNNKPDMITKLDIFKTDSFLNDDKAIIVNYPFLKNRHEDDNVLKHFFNELVIDSLERMLGDISGLPRTIGNGILEKKESDNNHKNDSDIIPYSLNGFSNTRQKIIDNPNNNKEFDKLDDILSLLQELRNNDHNIHEIMTQSQTFQRHIEKLESELKQTNAQLNTETKKHSDETHSFKLKESQLRSEITALKNGSLQQENKINLAHSQLKSLEKQNQSFIQENDKLKQSERNLEIKICKIDADLASARTKISELEHENQHKLAENDNSWENKENSLKSELYATERSLKELKAYQEQLKAGASIDQIIKDRQGELEKQLKDLTAKSRESKNSNEGLKIQESAQSKSKNQELDNIQLRRRIQDLEKRLSEAQSSRNAENELINKELSVLRAENSRLKTETKESSEIHRKNQSLEEQTAELSKLRPHIKSLEKHVAELERVCQHMSESESHAVDLLERNKDLENQVAELSVLRKRLRDSDNQINELRSIQKRITELETVQTEYDMQKLDFDKMLQENKVLKQENVSKSEELKQYYQNMMAELEQANYEISNLKSQVLEIEKENKNLMAEKNQLQNYVNSSLDLPRASNMDDNYSAATITNYEILQPQFSQNQDEPQTQYIPQIQSVQSELQAQVHYDSNSLTSTNQCMSTFDQTHSIQTNQYNPNPLTSMSHSTSTLDHQNQSLQINQYPHNIYAPLTSTLVHNQSIQYPHTDPNPLMPMNQYTPTLDQNQSMQTNPSVSMNQPTSIHDQNQSIIQPIQYPHNNYNLMNQFTPTQNQNQYSHTDPNHLSIYQKHKKVNNRTDHQSILDQNQAKITTINKQNNNDNDSNQNKSTIEIEPEVKLTTESWWKNEKDN
ncbi:20766_t:CDS:2 [Entrophospora sp. SA101]|nr:16861_t:CDS:2 [Entrophospora sp. SA101]CAJ0757762.1 20766_t:CDS:2 [Entrophospora sp. SA101]